MSKNTGIAAYINAGEDDVTLRDYFAAKAMQALITGILSNGEAITPRDDDSVAERSYALADAMLAERAK